MLYWLGGGSCGGKSSVADWLGANWGWHIYHVDEWYENHKARATAVSHPTIYQLSRLWGDDLWLRPVAEQVRTGLDFAREEFALLREDIAAQNASLSQSDVLLVEGFPVIPDLVAPYLLQPHHAFWLMPDPALQRARYAQRPWVKNVLSATSDPQRAFDYWMARDAGLAQAVEQQVLDMALNWLRVDGSLSVADTAVLVGHTLQGR
jgi:uridine kinase